jgi:hypothetical protein
LELKKMEGWRWKKKKMKGVEEQQGEEQKVEESKGVWQGVAMDSLKYHSGSPCLTLPRPAGGPPLKRPQGERPVAVFYPFGHPTP